MRRVSKVEVLLEEIKSKVYLSLEGHEVLRNEMRQMEGRLTERIEENSSNIKFVASKVNVIEKRVNNIDERVNSIDERVNRIDMRVDSIDKRVNRIDVRVGSIDKKLDQHILQTA